MKRDKLHRLGRVRMVWDYMVTSFWLVPGLMIGLAVLLAVAARRLDVTLSGTPPAWWVYEASADDARKLLSTLLSSMINMTTLVFSVTMVVLTLAASQFGPRLIRNFMSSPQTQFVLGTFVMTIVYCLVVLPMIGARGPAGPLPFPTVSIALMLVIASVILLVAFIHGLGRSIVSESVIERVGRELDQVIDALDPLDPLQQAPTDPAEALPAGFVEREVRFGPPSAGYVQAIDFKHLVRVAQKRDLVIGFYFQAGDYVAADGNGIAVFPPERCTRELMHEISGAITLGAHRTPVQDMEFSIRHLVEIAVRALSPGTNDPYTAVAVLHRLSASLSRLMSRSLPEAVFRDDHHVVRVVCPRPSYGGLINGAFDQIRQNGADKPLVVIHLFEALVRIAPHTRVHQQVDALTGISDQIMAAAADAVSSAADVAKIRERYGKAIDALNAASMRIADEVVQACAQHAKLPH